MIIAKENIEQYIPHRKPFVMVDNIVTVTPDLFESNFKITPDNIFVQDGLLSESALIENMAQTCAAAFGYMQRQADEAPKIGVIAGVSDCHCTSLPSLGALVQTRIDITMQIGTIYVVKGHCSVENEKIFECELKIMIP